MYSPHFICILGSEPTSEVLKVTVAAGGWSPLRVDLPLDGAETGEEVTPGVSSGGGVERVEDLETVHLRELGANGLGDFVGVHAERLLDCKVEVLPDQKLHHVLVSVPDVGSGKPSEGWFTWGAATGAL